MYYVVSQTSSIFLHSYYSGSWTREETFTFPADSSMSPAVDVTFFFISTGEQMVTDTIRVDIHDKIEVEAFDL